MRKIHEYLLTILSERGDVIETRIMLSKYDENTIGYKFKTNSKYNIIYLGLHRKPRRLVRIEKANI